MVAGEVAAAEMITTDINRHVEQLLWAAKGDPKRLGWIHEQMMQKLAVPENWVSNEELNQRARQVVAQTETPPHVVEARKGLQPRRTQESA